MTVGARIMQLRLNRGYTREQLAYLADISEKFFHLCGWKIEQCNRLKIKILYTI